MSNEQLTAYLKDESYLYSLSYEELKTLVVEYPYAANLRILLLKKSYIDKNKDYDGLIIFTDGYASRPKLPKNNKTRILWLFNDEDNYKAMAANVKGIGKTAFLK